MPNAPIHSRTNLPKGVEEALARLPDSAWTIFKTGPDHVTSVAMMDVNGVATKFLRTQYIADELLQKANTQEYNDSEGKKWKDGRVVARLPMNMIFQTEIAQKLREGDRDHLTYWLNKEENKPFRTFRGKV